MTVIDGTSTTTPTFEVGQRVKYATTHSPSGRNMGNIYAYDEHGVDHHVEIDSIGEVTYTSNNSIRVRFEDGRETRLVAAWRFEPVVAAEDPGEPLADWERALLELPAPAPLVEETTRALQVGDEVEIDPGTRSEDGAWYYADPYPTRGRIVELNTNRGTRHLVEAIDGSRPVTKTNQTVSHRFLRLATTPETPATPAPAADPTPKPWEPKVDEVVMIDDEKWNATYSYSHGRFAQVLNLGTKYADVVFLDADRTSNSLFGTGSALKEWLIQVPEGVEAPKPLIRKKSIVRYKNGGGAHLAGRNLRVGGTIYTDGSVVLTDLEGGNLTEARVWDIEHVPPIPMEPGQVKADDIVSGEEYRLHPDATSLGTSGGRAFKGSGVERVLASCDFLSSSDKEAGVYVYDLAGKYDIIQPKWLVPLDWEQEPLSGGEHLKNRRGEIFTYVPVKGGSPYVSSPPTRVQLLSDMREPNRQGKWRVIALDGYYKNCEEVVPVDSLKPYTRSLEHEQELKVAQLKIKEAKAEVEKQKSDFEALLTEMFMVMDERAEHNGLCGVWEKERDGAILKFFKKNGLNPATFPASSYGDVFIGQGRRIGQAIFVTHNEGGHRKRKIIDRNGEVYETKKFIKDLSRGLWKPAVRGGEIVKD